MTEKQLKLPERAFFDPKTGFFVQNHTLITLKKTTLYNCFMLPEKYKCPTHVEPENYNKIRDHQKSDFFSYTTQLETCNNEPYEVTCWIQWSYMKRKAYICMYFVGLIGCAITVVELIYQLIRNFYKVTARANTVRKNPDLKKVIKEEQVKGRGIWPGLKKQLFGIDQNPKFHPRPDPKEFPSRVANMSRANTPGNPNSSFKFDDKAMAKLNSNIYPTINSLAPTPKPSSGVNQMDNQKYTIACSSAGSAAPMTSLPQSRAFTPVHVNQPKVQVV